MHSTTQIHSVFPPRCFCVSPSSQPGGVPVVGIDPGVNGAFAVLDSSGKAEAFRMPRTVDGKDVDYSVLVAYFEDLRSYGIQNAYVEGLVKFAGRMQSGSTAIVYGYNSGAIRGILETLKFQIHYIFPTHWMRHFTVKSSGDFKNRTAWKTFLREIASSFFPYLKVTKADCDALLIAKYGHNFLNSTDLRALMTAR